MLSQITTICSIPWRQTALFIRSKNHRLTLALSLVVGVADFFAHELLLASPYDPSAIPLVENLLDSELTTLILRQVSVEKKAAPSRLQGAPGLALAAREARRLRA